MANRRTNKVGRDTRDRLLAAGISAFHSGGFNGTGLDQIVKEASVPKGSFYNFFDSKATFAEEVVDLYFDRHKMKLSEFLNNGNLTPLGRIEAYFDERIAFFTGLEFRRGCMMGNLSVETSDQNDGIRQRLDANFTDWTDAFARVIRDGQESGQITSSYAAENLAHFLLNSWEGAILRMKVEKNVKALENAKAMLISFLSGTKGQ